MHDNQRIIQNQYKLLGPVGSGEGGMGVVYRAVDLTLDRDVAVKLIRPELHGNADMEKRFQREARALARLNHPNIANIYNFCQDGNEYCLIMEFVNGRNLSDLLRSNGKFSQTEAIQLIVQALNGLAHAHDRGVLHRDLKPANLMLTDEGIVKILDFGIARLTDSPSTHTTQTNNLTGTIRYMAPELLDHGQPSASSDLYAMNLVLYELLTGRAAFKAPTVMRLITQILNKTPPPLSDLLPHIPNDLEKLMERMMAKQPIDRINDARLFAKALEIISPVSQDDGEPEVVLAPETVVKSTSNTRLLNHPTVKPPLPAKKNQYRWLWPIAAFGAALLGAGLYYATEAARQPVADKVAPRSSETKTIRLKPIESSVHKLVPKTAASPVVLPTGASKPAASSTSPTPKVKPQPARVVPPLTAKTVKPQPTATSRVNQGRQPTVAAVGRSGPASLSVSLKNVAISSTSNPTATPVERTTPTSNVSTNSIALTRQTTLRLTPISEYRADQLHKGDEVLFTVTALIDGATVSLGQDATARGIVSEVKAIGGLNNRSYIFLKRIMLKTTQDEAIKLLLASSEPEIYFDGKQTNAVVGPLLMRPNKPFTITL